MNPGVLLQLIHDLQQANMTLRAQVQALQAQIDAFVKSQQTEEK